MKTSAIAFSVLFAVSTLHAFCPGKEKRSAEFCPGKDKLVEAYCPGKDK